MKASDTLILVGDPWPWRGSTKSVRMRCQQLREPLCQATTIAAAQRYSIADDDDVDDGAAATPAEFAKLYDMNWAATPAATPIEAMLVEAPAAKPTAVQTLESFRLDAGEEEQHHGYDVDPIDEDLVGQALTLRRFPEWDVQAEALFECMLAAYAADPEVCVSYAPVPKPLPRVQEVVQASATSPNPKPAPQIHEAVRRVPESRASAADPRGCASCVKMLRCRAESTGRRRVPLDTG